MHHFRAVGNFFRTQEQVFLVLGNVLIETGHTFRRRAEGRTRRNQELAGINEVEHAVLNNFGINRQVFEVRINETSHNSVSYIAYTRLQRQQVLRHTASLYFLLEEVQRELAHLTGIIINGLQGTRMVRNIARNDVFNLVRRAGNVRRTYTVRSLYDRNRQTVRRIHRGINIMHTLEFQRLGSIDFHDNRISTLHIRGSIAQRRRRDNIAFFRNSTGLNDSHINLAEITAAAELSRLGKMQVQIIYGTVVYFIAQVLIRLVG